MWPLSVLPASIRTSLSVREPCATPSCRLLARCCASLPRGSVQGCSPSTGTGPRGNGHSRRCSATVFPRAGASGGRSRPPGGRGLGTRVRDLNLGCVLCQMSLNRLIPTRISIDTNTLNLCPSFIPGRATAAAPPPELLARGLLPHACWCKLVEIPWASRGEVFSSLSWMWSGGGSVALAVRPCGFVLVR